MRLRSFQFLLALTSLLFLALRASAEDQASFDTIDLDGALPLDRLASQLAAKRVVLVGESHDRYDHHLNQLEIIRRLYMRDPNLAIGVEYLQQPFQAQVDDYIAGRTSETEFLRATEYFKGWGYDYRLYAPIFRFAREQHIPVRALNVPTAVASAVAKLGIAGLSPQQRAYLPEKIEPADEDYKARLRAAFEEHGSSKPGAFDHFVDAQLTWDEGMATSAAAYLKANPGRRMVILAGSGHVAFGSGIPSRLERQTQATYAIVLNNGEQLAPHMADYVLLSKKQELPPAGVLGVTLEEKNGHCQIRSLSAGGAADKAGLKKGDVLVGIAGQAIRTIADSRVALWDKKPGERVAISLRPKRWRGIAPVRSLEVELGAAGKAGGR